MIVFKCKMCGGNLDVSPEMTVGACQSCGSTMTLPKLSGEKRANLYERANSYRMASEYDRALGIYESILSEDITDAEAYWSLVLCKYGIEYVEDPKTHKRIPTCNRIHRSSILADTDYKNALTYASGEAKALYEEEAEAIETIRKGMMEISAHEKDFDIFLCYKEADERGRRTLDSVVAQDIYAALTEEGYKVFFARVTLEDKQGTAYEPYIYAALHSAKVMLVVGTKPEYFNAVWVKNEWSRYLTLIKSGAKKTLIPAYKNMATGDLPEEMQHLQAQNLGELGFMQDLVRGIQKILPKAKYPGGAPFAGLPEGMQGTLPVWTELNIDTESQIILGISGPAGSHLFIPAQAKAIAPGAFMNIGELNTVTGDFEKAQLREIPENAFAGCENLEILMLPEKITSIGKGAFSGCAGLRHINLPENLTSIGEDAFAGCKAMESISLPRGFKSIGKGAFAGCTALTQADFHDLKSLGEGAFTGCRRMTNLFFHGETIRLPAISRGAFADCTSLENIIFHDSTKTIEENAFAGCTGLKKLDFSFDGGLRTIKKNAFLACTGLRSIALPEEFKSIEEGAFAGCTALESVAISGKAAVAPGAFEGCVKLRNFEIEGKRLESLAWLAPFFEGKTPRLSISDDIEIIGDGAFRDCGFLLPIKIPEDVTVIGKHAFAGLADMKEITIPRKVTVIGEGAFAGCGGLTKLAFEDNSELQTIGDRAFEGCAELVKIEVPGTVTSIGPEAFAGCGKLRAIHLAGTTAALYGKKKIAINHPAVTTSRDDIMRIDRARETQTLIPANAKEIDDEAFRFCTGIKSAAIPGKVRTIGRAAFEGCAALESIAFPTKLDEICDRAFKDCTGLRSLTFPNHYLGIGDEAFSGCTGIQELTIDGDILRAEGIFAGCTGLKKIIFKDLHVVGDKTFMGCTGLESVIFPVRDSGGISAWLKKEAFAGCAGLTSLRLPATTNLEDRAFAGCTGLGSLTLPANILMGDGAFSGCTALEEVTFLGRRTYGPIDMSKVFEGTPFLVRYERRAKGLCVHCGGKRGFFGKCKNCGVKN